MPFCKCRKHVKCDNCPTPFAPHLCERCAEGMDPEEASMQEPHPSVSYRKDGAKR